MTSSYSFSYTGNVQTFVVPESGYYQLEVWGAAGGNATTSGTAYKAGYGGYATGVAKLLSGDTLYIYVGGQGSAATAGTQASHSGGYNGGGAGWNRSGSGSAGSGGGGATHIATVSGLLSTLSNNRDAILIVAGGGGGSYVDTDNAGYCTYGGNGGGYLGHYAVQFVIGSAGDNPVKYNYPSGGSQTSGGLGVTNWQSGTTSNTNYVGTFGQGATGVNSYGGGGGGLWGGASGNYCGGGGGSGYIANPLLFSLDGITKHLTGCNVETSDEDDTRTNSTVAAANLPVADLPQTGNGSAKITFLKGLTTTNYLFLYYSRNRYPHETAFPD